MTYQTKTSSALKALTIALALTTAAAGAARAGNTNQDINRMYRDLNKVFAVADAYHNCMKGAKTAQATYDACTTTLNSTSSSPDVTAQLYFNRAVALTRLGKSEAALHDLDHVLAIQPGNPAAFTVAGVALMRLPGRTEAAIHDFTVALNRAPNDTYVHYIRGMAYVKIGTACALHAANEDFSAAIAAQPSKVSFGYEPRGMVYLALGRRQAAAHDFEACLFYDPLNTTCRTGLDRAS